MRLRAFAAAFVVALLAAGTAQAEPRTMTPDVARHVHVQTLRLGVEFQRAATWRWQDAAGVPRTRSTVDVSKLAGVPYLRWIARHWNRLRVAARTRARTLPPHYQQWLCIHSHEGVWDDHGSPYWGGLQMDMDFQTSYGGALLRAKGTADNWTPLEQMWVAERAYASGRGFDPWPQTAARCGLL